MKSFFRYSFVILLVLTLILPISAAPTTDARTLNEAIQKACPVEFRYVDNTEYYMSTYFSDMKNVDDFHIITCADSTNFNEIGVFHVKDTGSIQSNTKTLKKYLLKIKQNFENGVVYNTMEYPKFENAKVFAVGNYLIYTVMDKDNVKKAENAANNYMAR